MKTPPTLATILLFSTFLAGAAGALEIPLKHRGAAASGGGGGATVGFVDMEAIFQEYPETQKAKSEYVSELSARRQALADLEKELEELREQLGVLRATLKEMQEGAPAAPPEEAPGELTAPDGVAPTETPGPFAPGGAGPGSLTQTLGVSSGSVSAVNESLLQREKALADKEAALDQARLDAVKTLKELEERRSLQIMGKLYKALVQLAEEQGVTMIVDKRSILYGEAAMDLTERLRRRVRGLPDPEFER